MRKLTLAIAASLIGSRWSIPAYATSGNCGNSESASYADCDVTRQTLSVSTNPAAGGAPGTVAGSGSGPSTRYVAYDRLTTDADGQGCVTTGYVAEGVTVERHPG